MHKRLYSFIAHKGLIQPQQFGFLKNSSVDHTLISMTEAIGNILDNKIHGCGLFIDLQKAFDHVIHDILMLVERYQYVAVEDPKS